MLATFLLCITDTLDFIQNCKREVICVFATLTNEVHQELVTSSLWQFPTRRFRGFSPMGSAARDVMRPVGEGWVTLQPGGRMAKRGPTMMGSLLLQDEVDHGGVQMLLSHWF